MSDAQSPDVFNLDAVSDPMFAFSVSGKVYEVEPFSTAARIKSLTLNPLADTFPAECDAIREAFGLPARNEPGTLSDARCVQLAAAFGAWLKRTLEAMGESLGRMSK